MHFKRLHANSIYKTSCVKKHLERNIGQQEFELILKSSKHRWTFESTIGIVNKYKHQALLRIHGISISRGVPSGGEGEGVRHPVRFRNSHR
jgi:hypothetical protein